MLSAEKPNEKADVVFAPELNSLYAIHTYTHAFMHSAGAYDCTFDMSG